MHILYESVHHARGQLCHYYVFEIAFHHRLYLATFAAAHISPLAMWILGNVCAIRILKFCRSAL